MSIYRVKQFMWAITAPFKTIDKKMLEKYLDKEELEIFKKLKVSEQQHCIRVCRDALKESDYFNKIDKKKLAKIALLHDIGKIESNINVIEKSIIVVLDKFTKGNLKNYASIKKIDVYYNHPIIGLRMLKEIQGYDKEFLEAVSNHHHTSILENNYLEIIKKCDNKN